MIFKGYGVILNIVFILLKPFFAVSLSMILSDARLFAVRSLCALCMTAALAAASHASPLSPGRNKGSVDVLPAFSFNDPNVEAAPDSPTHPAIKLTPDKSELITLDKEIATVIVGNPNHLNVLAESSKLLVLVPRAAGASYFTALDKSGNVVMQRHVIVASPKNDYVRIRKSCAGSKDKACQTTRVYYCPDMCHEITMGSQQDAKSDSTDKDAEDNTFLDVEATEDEKAEQENAQ